MDAMREGSTADVPVSGHVDPGFEAVRDAFAHLVSSGDETGAGLTVIHRGRAVVDLCGGWADAARTRAWTHDTMVNTFSVTKAFAALALLVLVDRGRAGLDDRVADHWPEFATAGKADTTVRQVLAHQAGLPAFPVPRGFDDVGDWNLLTADLAAAEPEWPPGTAHGEHALTFGHLVGELVRRIDGRSLDRFLREEIDRALEPGLRRWAWTRGSRRGRPSSSTATRRGCRRCSVNPDRCGIAHWVIPAGAWT